MAKGKKRKNSGGKSRRGARVMISLTAALLALSAGAYGAKYLLEKQRAQEDTAPQMVVPEAQLAGSESAGSLTAGSNVMLDPAVTVTKGQAYVRFTVQLCDSDGLPFTQKLIQKNADIEEFYANLNSDSPSYLAFYEAYHGMLNDYNLLYAKASLAWDPLCRDEDYGGGVSPNLPPEQSVDSAALQKLSADGKVSLFADGEQTASDFVVAAEEGDPFARQYIYKEPLSEGESCALFTNVVIPTDWESAQTVVTTYYKQDDHTYFTEDTGVSNLEILGEGYSLRVSAEIVDASISNSAEEAFAIAEAVPVDTETESGEEIRQESEAEGG